MTTMTDTPARKGSYLWGALRPAQAARACVLLLAMLSANQLATPPAKSAGEETVDLRYVAIVGNPAPGTEAGTVFNNFVSPASINNNETVVFVANLDGGGTIATNNLGLWSGTPGNLMRIARKGEQAPGTEPGVTFLNMVAVQLNEQDEVLFAAALAGAAVTSANDLGIFLYRNGALALIAREGDQAPGLSAGVTFGSIQNSVGKIRLGADGRVAFYARLTGPGITEDNDFSIWVGTTGIFQLVMRDGDQVPGAASGTIYRTRDLRDSTLAMSRSGALIFNAKTRTAVGAGSEAVISGAPGNLRLVAERGDAAPGAANGGTFLFFNDARINDAGVVAFGATVEHTDGSPVAQGIWAGLPGALRRVLGDGDRVPGTSGDEAMGFTGLRRASPDALTASGKVGVWSDIELAGVQPSPRHLIHDEGLWLGDGDELALVAREGEQVPGLPRSTNGLLFNPDHPSPSALPNYGMSGSINAHDAVLLHSDISVFSNFIGQQAASGLWLYTEDGLDLLIRSGTLVTLPDGEIKDLFLIDPILQGGGADRTGSLNDHGQAVFRAAFGGHGNSDLIAIIETADPVVPPDPDPPSAFELIARKGWDAPGTAAGVTFHSFIQEAGINNAREVLFRARLIGLGVTNDNDHGIWRGTSRTDLTLIAREGDQAPGTPAGVTFKVLNQEFFNQSGDVVFKSTLRGPGVTNASDAGYWLYKDGALSLIVREGDRAPGEPAGPGAGANILNIGAIRISDNREVVFLARLTGTGVSSGNDFALWTGTPGSYRLVAREGDPVPGRPGATFEFQNTRDGVAMNAGGRIAFNSGIVGATGKTLAVFAGKPGALSLVAESRTAAPGTPAGVEFSGFEPPMITDSGDVVFGATLVGPGVRRVNDGGIWGARAGSIELIARERDALPGVPAGVTLNFPSPPTQDSVNKNGNVFLAAYGNLIGAGVNTGNDQSMWFGRAGTLRLVGREGDSVPGVGGEVQLDHFNRPSPAFRGSVNGVDEIVFYSFAAAGSQSRSTGLWLYKDGTITSILGFEQEVEIDPGVTVTIRNVGQVKAGGAQSGLLGSINDDGDVVAQSALLGPTLSNQVLFIVRTRGR